MSMPARTRSARQRALEALDKNFRELERRLPKNLRGALRDLRSNLKALQRQVDRARVEREQRWRRLEKRIRSDTARLLRRLERAVAPAGSSSASSKPRARRKSTARKKKTARSS
jgi:hypothetical protein